MIPPSLLQRLFMVCVLFLLAVLALEWAADVLQRIWPTLAVVAAVGFGLYGLLWLYRWHRDRW